MSTNVKLKRSGISGRVPTTSNLELGELAINTYDGKLYLKKNDGSESIVDVTYQRTDSELLAAIKNVDGTGSGLDADLLDGQEGSYYLDWTNTTNKPDPTITVTLTGDVTGTANTTLTDLGNGTITVATTRSVADYIDLTNNLASSPSHTEGRIFYSDEYKALTVYNDITGSSLQVGHEDWIRVYNNTGSQIDNGTPLYVTGANGETPTVAPADATTEAKARVIGIATHDIADSSSGVATVRGLVSGIDTSALTAGQPVHVGADGSLQTAPPSYPYWPVDIGGCIVSDATDGYIYVRIMEHHMESFRVSGNQHNDGNLTVDGDLIVNGTQTITTQNNLAINDSFVYLNSGDNIGESGTTFTGSGLDDAYFRGYFEGTTSTTFYVRIDGVGTGTGGVDTFEWSKDNFSTTEATGVDITGADQELSDNIKIFFNATTGHTSGDTWSGTAAPINVDTGWTTNRNTGTSGVGYTHMGVFFDVSDEKFKFFEEYDLEPNGSIDVNDASFNLGTVVASAFEGNLTGNVTGSSSLNVLKSGDTMSGNLTFPDYQAAIFGSGNDLQIYHDGSHSYIYDGGTGDLIVRANNLALQATSGEQYAAFVANGAASLFYDNGQKLATTSTGIDVTGTVTADGLTVDGGTINVNHSTPLIRFTDTDGTNQYLEARQGGGTSQFYSRNNTSDGNYVFYGNDGTSSTQKLRIASNGDISFYEDTGTTAAFFWDASAESLGLGTTSPSNQFHLQSSGVNYATMRLSAPDNTTPAEYLVRAHDGVFDIRDASAGTTRLTISSAGNVGIGTTSPDFKLSLNGGMRIENLSTSPSSGSGTEYGYNTSNNEGFQITRTKGVGTSTYRPFIHRAEYISFGTGTTSTTERMRIDSSGNVGIGVVPKSDWNSAVTGLAIGNDGTFYDYGGDVRMSNNYYLDASNYRYLNNGYALRYNQNNGDGTHRWYNTASGTAGNVVTFSERMRLDNSGNLLVGQSTASDTNAGIYLAGDGRATINRDGNFALQLNRLTSDGEILRFRKDSTTVGSIGSDNGTSLYIEGNNTGLLFQSSNMVPVNGSGVATDAAKDLGASGVRFKDLYLSGYSTAAGYKTPGGTSSGFLKADGSIDTTTYATTAGANTTYTISAEDHATDTTKKHIRLTGSDSTTDDVTLVAGNNVSISRTNDEITISSGQSSNFSFADGAKATFGDDNDLQIYHDGSHSFVTDSGTGNLRLQGTNLALQNAAGTKNYLLGSDGGATTLYYNNAAKLATTSTGIDVTGTVTADGLTVDGNLLVNTGSPDIYLGTSSASHYNWRIAAQEVVDAGFEIAVGTQSAGSAAESDTYSTLMTVKNTGNVGIGTTSPSARLHVYDANSSSTNYKNSDAALLLTNGGTNSTNLKLEGEAAFVYGNGSSSLRIADRENERIRIDSSGNVGIGTTTPSEKLEVNGNIKHSGLTMTSGTDIDQLYSTTVSLTLAQTWQDVGVNGTNLATGTYIVQVYVNDWDVGGTQYTEYYSGTMSWFDNNTNSTISNEIPLHNAGHAPNVGAIFLRTLRTTNGSGGLKLQIAGNTNNTGASNYTFKFRRMI